MNNLDLSPAVIQGMNVTRISDYLRSKGWDIEENLGEKATVWANDESDYEIIVPLKKELGDYTKRILELLEILETTENRSRLDILNDLLEPSQVSTVMGREVVMFSLTFPTEYGSEAPIFKLANILMEFQKIIYHLGKRILLKKSITKNLFELKGDEFLDLEDKTIDDKIGEELNLTAFGAFHVAFGIKLTSSPISSLAPAVMPEILKEFYGLIGCGDDIDQILPRLLELPTNAIHQYVNFLTALKSAQADLFFEWGSTHPEYGGSCHLSHQTAENAVNAINHTRSGRMRFVGDEHDPVSLSDSVQTQLPMKVSESPEDGY